MFKVFVKLHPSSLTVYTENLEGCRFVTKGLFVDVLTMGTYKIYFSQHSDLPYNVSKSMANTKSKQHVLLMSRDKEKP